MNSKQGFIGRLTINGTISVATLSIAVVAGCESTPKSDSRLGRSDPPPQMEDPMRDRADAGNQASESRTVRWTPEASERAMDGSGSGSTDQSTNPMSSLSQDRRTGWSIAMATLTMDDHASLAQQWAADFTAATGMSDVWIERTSKGSVVRYGSYPSFDSPAAQRDLGRIKQTDVNGSTPFGRSYLSQVTSESRMGDASPLHLSRAREYFPGEDSVYSLQVAVYEPVAEITREECRKLAEEAAQRLRAQGDLAFYYHGPNRSMVCVGVFGPDAVDTSTYIYSAPVRELQKRYPYNAFNGLALIEKRASTAGGIQESKQPSFLVPVPKAR